jgi:hypothetical protein
MQFYFTDAPACIYDLNMFDENVGYSTRMRRGRQGVVGRGWRPTILHLAGNGSAQLRQSYHHKWPTVSQFYPAIVTQRKILSDILGNKNCIHMNIQIQTDYLFKSIW